MATHLSTRGQRLVDAAPMSGYLRAHFDRVGDRYDPVTRPGGYIGLCVAENKLVWDLLGPRLTSPRPELGHDSVCYDEMIGCRRFREQVADFMSRAIHGRRFAPEQIAVLAGTGSVLETLFYAIADPGDAVLVPTPSYAGFFADLETRDQLSIIPVHTRSVDGFTLTPNLLDAALSAATRPVKALLYTNPNNPTGAVASAEEVATVMGWAEDRRLHLVLDEVYALSVYGDTPFISGASLRPSLGDRVHLCWAFSKDFGVSGLRCGVLVTENEALMRSVDALAYWAAVSGDTQHVLGAMVSDTPWVKGYVAAMRARLRDSYTAVTTALDAAGIPFVPAEGGHFLLCDLRQWLATPTWEAEDALWGHLLERANVNLTPGSACRNGEPGFMRLCFATEPKEAVAVAVGRIAATLATIPSNGAERCEPDGTPQRRGSSRSTASRVGCGNPPPPASPKPGTPP